MKARTINIVALCPLTIILVLSLSLISTANYEAFFVECHQCAQCCNQAIKPELGKDVLKLQKLAEKQNGDLEPPILLF